MKYNTLLLLLFFSSLSVFSQDNSLENQFDEVLKKSNNYQEYKVVKKTDLNTLKSNTLSTVSQLESTIESSTQEINSQKSTITNLNKELESTKNNLEISKDKEKNIEVFGFKTTKGTYNTGMFSFIGLLLFTIIVLFIKYNNSNRVTKSTKIKLSETEDELESFRHRTIEKEQQLRRKLQDEINKNKGLN